MNALLLTWLFALGACVHASDRGPELVAVTPPAAGHSAIVTLSGARLCGPVGDCTNAGGQVQIGLVNPVAAVIISYADTSAQIIIPTAAPLGPTELLVTVNDRASTALAFEVLQ